MLILTSGAFALEQVNCFDYYKFGSVKVDIQSQTPSSSSGSTMSFTAVITNENPYPIFDGSVYVKVFRKQTDNIEELKNGGALLDQFFVADNIALDVNGKKQISFDWKVPSFTQSGDYEIDSFFVTEKKFNLYGLSFTDDVVGARYFFKISGEQNSIVEFDKNAVMINGKPHQFIAFIPQVSPTGTVKVTAQASNNTLDIQNADISWRLYSWDGLTEANLISEKKETIGLNPGEKRILQFNVNDTTKPVYFIVAELDYKDSKSILDIRFARKGVDRTRINFPSLLSFPLEAGKESTVFSCVHGMGTAKVVPDNNLKISILDESGKVIFSDTYDGNITGEMMGLKESFVLQKDYSKVTLKAELYMGGMFVDGAEVVYDCTLINCPKKQDLLSFDLQNPFLIGIGLIALLFILGILFLHLSKRIKRGEKK